MNSNHWQRIEELFHAASELPAADRTVFLNSECSGDELLRGEVESLIAASEDEISFMQQPAISMGMRVISDAHKESLVGESFGHYKIIRLLGEGGMGEVYLAEDVTLERYVALKFLAPGLVDVEWAREQLMKEARAVARLENPNICAVFGLEEIGVSNFIVMQYVEGETLASLLNKGPLKLESALEFAEQIAGALAAAHARGIVHRDIKPQNIVVTPEGQAKVLDFGLAKLAPRNQSIGEVDRLDQTSQRGLLLGTVAYMSPEQARGEELDCGSDIFSFGIVLYEMFGMSNPFLRETREDTIDAIKTEEAPPLPNKLPAELVRIGRKSLHKNLQNRYETAAQLLVDLRRLRKSRERATIMGWRRYMQYYAAAALVLLILVFAGAGYAYRKATRVHTLALVRIVNESGDPDKNYLSDGLTRNLFDKFSYLPRLKVKLPTVVPSRENDQLIQAGRNLKVDAVLFGDVIKQGDELVLRLQLLNVADGVTSWSQTFRLDSIDMFALQDAITSKVTSTLGLWLIGDEKKLLTRRQTDNQEAMKAYMRGRQYWSLKRDRENLQTAISFFDQAINLDPSFGQAYAGRADCYVLRTNVLYGSILTSEAMEKAAYDARQAIAIDPLLAEAHTSLGSVYQRYYWDWQQSEKEFKVAIDLNPEYAPAHYSYSNLLALLGRFDESIRQSEMAKELDPYSPLANMNYGRALYYARRYDAAAEHFDQLLKVDSNSPQFLLMRGLVYLQQRQYPQAITTLERFYDLDHVAGAASLGYAYAKAGRRKDVERILEEMDRFPEARPVLPHERALIYIGLNEKDQAFELLEKAFQDRFANLAFLTTDPIYDDLRSDARFNDLARRLNLLR